LPDADSENGREGKLTEFSPEPAEEIETNANRDEDSPPP